MLFRLDAANYYTLTELLFHRAINDHYYSTIYSHISLKYDGKPCGIFDVNTES